MVPSQGSFVAMEFLTHSLLLFSCILIAQIGNIHVSSCLLYLSFASCPRLPFFLSAMSKRCFSLILISIISIPSQCFRQSNFILQHLCYYFYRKQYKPRFATILNTNCTYSSSSSRQICGWASSFNSAVWHSK